jgi:hypothetical protein
MKYLQIAEFEALNSQLSNVDAGDCAVTIALEAYACRKSKDDKRLAQAIADGMRQRSDSAAEGDASATVTVDDRAGSTEYSNDLVLYLTSAINSVYGPDYDFSVFGDSIFELCDPRRLEQAVNEPLHRVGQAGVEKAEAFWRALGSQMPLAESEVFQVVLDQDTNPLHSKLWSSHFIVHCKRLKLMVSVLCYADGHMYDSGNVDTEIDGAFGKDNGGNDPRWFFYARQSESPMPID